MSWKGCFISKIPVYYRTKTKEKLLYGMMIDRMEPSQKNGWIDKQGRAYIYFTVDEVKDYTQYS